MQARSLFASQVVFVRKCGPVMRSVPFHIPTEVGKKAVLAWVVPGWRWRRTAALPDDGLPVDGEAMPIMNTCEGGRKLINAGDASGGRAPISGSGNLRIVACRIGRSSRSRHLQTRPPFQA